MSDVLYLCVVLLCIYISSGWGVSIPGGIACCFLLMCIINTVTGGVNVHYNRLSVCPLYH